jgi:hypothetical protein
MIMVDGVAGLVARNLLSWLSTRLASAPTACEELDVSLSTGSFTRPDGPAVKQPSHFWLISDMTSARLDSLV